MSKRGCDVTVMIPQIPEYLEELRREKASSKVVSDETKTLIDRVIKHREISIGKMLKQPEEELQKIYENQGKLRKVDETIVVDIEKCFKTITDYLTRHDLVQFTGVLLKKPLDVKSYPSPVSNLAVSVQVDREDHPAILRDLRVKIENSISLSDTDREILYQVLDSYKEKVENNCKTEGEYVENIKSVAEKINEERKPAYDSLQEMYTWIKKLEMSDGLE